MDIDTDDRSAGATASNEEGAYLEIAEIIGGLPPNVGLPMLVALLADSISRAGPEHAYGVLGLVTADLSGRVTTRLAEMRQAAN